MERYKNKYIFEYLQTSIVIIEKNQNYLLKISSPDGYHSEKYDELKSIRKYLDYNLELI